MMRKYPFSKQRIADSRVVGLVKGFLEAQLSAEEWATPFS